MFLRNFTVLLLAAICLFTAACPEPCEMPDNDVRAVHAELAPVVEGIENFRRDQKVYPHSLVELEPKYIEKIPEKAGEREFSFIRVSDDKYNIRVNAASGGSYSGSCTYSEVESRWKDIK